MLTFDHEKLDVWKLSLDFLAFADILAAQLSGTRYYIADQLRRAALSICLNTAEGAAEFSKPEKRRFYRIARRSAVECVAIIRCCQRLKIPLPHDTEEHIAILDRIIAMLTVLSKPGTKKMPT
ncbi:MAG: four helix bundle protein [Gemmatimonadota bacterium]